MNLMYNLTMPTVIDGQTVEAQAGSTGALRVELWNPSGTTAIASGAMGDALANGASGVYVVSRGVLYNGSTWDREAKPFSTARLVSAAGTTNATSVKASAGNIYKITLINAAATAKFLKLYNKASAPTVGTDTPVWTAQLPPTAVNGGSFDLDFGAQPLYFSTGIAYALTGAAADADATALTAADVVCLNIAYS
jgi:hypothetical protein